jgi:hypothetical protein
MELQQMKKLLHSQENSCQNQTVTTEWGKYVPASQQVRGQYPKHTKSPKNETAKEQIIQIINGQMKWTVLKWLMSTSNHIQHSYPEKKCKSRWRPEIPSRPSQNGSHQERKQLQMLVRMWRGRNPTSTASGNVN